MLFIRRRCEAQVLELTLSTNDDYYKKKVIENHFEVLTVHQLVLLVKSKGKKKVNQCNNNKMDLLPQTI